MKRFFTKTFTKVKIFNNIKRIYNTNETAKIMKGEEVIPPKSVKYWLIGTAGLVVSIVVIGGLTRLEEGGLSMVDWKPLGSLPPGNEEEWKEEFERYKQFPEYKKKNFEMTLSEFKYIFFYEYIHRMVGRLIGVTFVLPGIYFYSKGYFNSMLKRRIPFIGLLIGGQGLLGWYMVKSGLDENHRLMKEYNSVPRVSQYRLASHLSLAFGIYTTMLWTILDLNKNEKVLQQNTKAVKFLKRFLPFTTIFTFITVISGAFVAGMDAGLIYGDFPLMGGQIIPRGLLSIKPTYLNFFENSTTVQFDHRILAETIGCLVLFLFYFQRRNLKAIPKSLTLGFNFLLGITTLQISLGIATLMNQVPTPLAASHQLGSLTLLSTLIYLTHFLKKRF
eukprot:gene7247-11565_t